jgi:hypothetical protein
LPILSIWNAATYYVMFFTLKAEVNSSHYEEIERFSYHCLSDNCPACLAGIRPTEHVYLPVWDAQNRRIGVLKFHTGENGPAPRVLEFLRAYHEQLADVVALIRCEGKGMISITAHTPLPETDRGALTCEAFCRAVEAGIINFCSSAKQLSAEEMATLPSVKRNLHPVVGDPLGMPHMTPGLVGEVVSPRDDGKGV